MQLPEPDETPAPTCLAASKPWDLPWPQSAADFEALIDYFQDRLLRLAFRKVGCLAEAEEIVQEVFVRAFAQRAERANVTNVTPYLYRMTLNLCTDRHRRRRRDHVSNGHDILEPVDMRPGALERAMAAEELLRINKLLNCLPAPQAEVLRLSVLDELSMADIAKILDASIPTLKSRLRYGLKKLRRVLSSRKETTV